MTTSLMFMATEQTSAAQESTKNHIASEEIKLEPAKSRGRKPGKGPPHKKQPQRGMGVAQLERLRLQERWKKMTEINHVDPLDIPTQFNYQTAPSTNHLPFTEPIGGVPVFHGVAFYGGPTIGGDGFMGLDPRLGGQRFGTGGYAGFCGGGSGQVLVDQSRVGAPNMRLQMGSIVETSKELSSIPKLQQCASDSCDACFKKKRCDGLNIGFNGRTDKNAAISPTKTCDFLGLSQDKNANFNEEMGGFITRAARSALYAGHNLNEGVEVMAIHRKGNSENGGTVLMEYEFFPGKNRKSTCSKEIELPAEVSVSSRGEASYITTPPYGADHPTSVDLSLKL